jgi:2-oxoglutarate decarboxylase
VGGQAVSSPVTGTAPDDPTAGEFGANEWLVDELYERYLVDKNSVDKSWWPVLES